MDTEKEQYKTLKYYQSTIIDKIHEHMNTLDDEFMFKLRRNGSPFATRFLLNDWFRGENLIHNPGHWTLSI